MKDPVRSVNSEFLQGLEVISNKIYPLPGATSERIGDPDPRLGLAISNIPQNSKVTYFEHIATIRHRPSQRYFVAFRETMDALMARQIDNVKYPGWLIKSPLKKAELAIYIYAVKETSPGRPCIPSKMPNLSTHEDWLEYIGDGPDWLFDTIVLFLFKNDVIDKQMSGSIVGY